MADKYVSKVNLSHGQDRGEKKQRWHVPAGKVFDPSEMGMTKETLDGLVKTKRAVLHEGGEGSMARPVAAPVATPAPAAAAAGSTEGGRTAPTGGSTQGGKAPGGHQ